MINGSGSPVAQVEVLSSTLDEQQVASVVVVVVVEESELPEIRRSFAYDDDSDEMPTTDCAPLANLSRQCLSKGKRTAIRWRETNKKKEKKKTKQVRRVSSNSAFLAQLTLLASITIICLYLNSKAAAVATAANVAQDELNLLSPFQPVIVNENNNYKPIRAIRSPNQQLQQLQVPVKLVQWTREAVQYHEGSTLVLSCSLATSLPVGNKLKFSWFKAAKPIGANGGGSSAAGRLSIETLPDYSFLRLIDLRPSDSGAYTCAASTGNQEVDRTTTQVVVNVKLKWLTPPSGGTQANQTAVGNQHELHTVRAGQQVTFECSAAAQPTPRIRWFRLLPVGAGAAFMKQVAPSGSMSKQLQRNSNSNNNNHHSHHHHQQQQQQQQQLPARLEEAQIRAHLLQMEALGEQLTNQLYRIELGTAKEQNALDEWTMRSGWRLETSGGSSQHEIHSRLLLDKADANQQGLFECEVVASPSSTATTSAVAVAAVSGALPSSSSAASGSSAVSSADLLLPDLNEQQQQQTGDKLRKLFGLLVNGK